MRKRFFLASLACVAGSLVWLAAAASSISRDTAAACYSDLSKVPTEEVGVLLGCSPRLSDGRSNLYFERRVKAAADLFKAGKIRYVLVSGDNGRREYDEPSA